MPPSHVQELNPNELWLIATDEAGYGPVLGPLVVAATVWRAPATLVNDDWYPLLRDSITSLRPEPDDPRLWIADSKAVYQSGDTLCHLWRAADSALEAELDGAIGPGRNCLPSLWRHFDRRYGADAGRLPWVRGFDPSATRSTFKSNSTPGVVRAPSPPIREIPRSQVPQLLAPQLHAARATVVWPPRINQLVRRHGNKATLLSHLTLRLVNDILMSLPAGPVEVWCDKHGGRARYGSIVQHFFPGPLVSVIEEGRARSEYLAAGPRGPLRLRFLAGSERLVPTAYASLIAKLLRELSMAAWNSFWRAREPSLRPTAGYYVDGMRFLEEVAATAARERIPPDWLRRSV